MKKKHWRVVFHNERGVCGIGLGVSWGQEADFTIGIAILSFLVEFHYMRSGW